MSEKTTAEARKIWKDFSEKKTSEEETKNLLLEFMFRRKFELGLASMSEDDFSDFLVYMAEHFVHILKKYNPEISDFSTYIYGVLQASALWRKKKQFLVNEKKSFCETLVVEESNFVLENEEIYFENEMTTEELYKVAKKNLEYSACSRHSERKTKISESFTKELCLVLALKSCYSITDPLVEKVSAATGCNKEKLRKMIMSAKESIEKKEMRFHNLFKKRNFAYFHRKKFSMQKQREAQKESDCTEYELQKFNSHDKRWRKSIEELSRQIPIPTNITVGKLLSMSPRHVASLVSKAKEIFSGDE